MIKKIIIYLLSTLMIFAPAYSAYASVLPSKGQIIAIGKKGAAMIKTSGGRIVKGGAIGIGIEGARIGIGAAISWCKNNQKKCKDKIGDIAEIVCDDFECTVEKPDDKEYPQFQFELVGLGRIFDTPDEMCNFYMDKMYPDATQKTYHNHYEYIVGGSDYQLGDKFGCKMTIKTVTENVDYTDEVGYDPKIVYMGIVISSSNKNVKLTDDELNDLAKKIAEKMDNNDITNYYNTEYGDIIINNRKYDGDEINQQTNIDNKCQNNSCNELSKEVENAVRKGKIDIDDVNEKNCTMEENTGKYIACNMTIKNDEQENETPPKDDTDTDIPKKEDDDPLTCDSSNFHRKICEWMDWTQDDLDAQDDGKAEIKDLSKDLELDDDKINFGRACPSGPIVNISFAGVAVSHDISYEGLCGAFEKMRPFVIGIGGIVSVMIIGGRRA